MTRLALLSDIHGNLPALQAVIADMEQFNLETVVVNGDSINWGPQSYEVTERLLELGWPVLRGNNELYLLDYDTARAPASWSSFTMPPWLHGQMRDLLPVIASWPDTLQLRFRDAPPVRVLHGFPENPFDTWHPVMTDTQCEARLEPVAEDFLFSAHSHLAMTRQVGRWTIFNAGSVGCPLDGDMRASYLLMEGDPDGWRGTLRSVAYNLQPVFDAFQQQDFVGQVGKVGRLIIEEYKVGSLRLYPFKLWLRDAFPGEVIRDIDVSDAQIDAFLTLSQEEMERYMPPQYWVRNLSTRP
jgi:predicted phosphodiesterase